MSVHNRMHRRHAHPDPAPVPVPDSQTLYSVVYVTASKTFDGPVAGYSTQTGVPLEATKAPAPSPSPSPSPSPAPPPAPVSHPPPPPQSESSLIADSSSQPPTQKLQPTPSPSPSPSQSQAPTTLQSSTSIPTQLSSSMTVASTVPILVASTLPSTVSQAASEPTAISSAQSSSSSGGMSGAGKAGMAVGVLLAFGAILVMVLYCFRKRRETAKGEKMEDEKHDFGEMAGPDMRQMNRQSIAKSITSAKAPRLSLKRASQFLPDLSIKPKRESKGNALALIPESRPGTAHSNHQDNPFGNHAEIDTANANGPVVVGANGEMTSQAPAQLSRGASKRGPTPMDFTKGGPFRGPPSPAGSEFSTASDITAAPSSTPTGNAIAAAGGPPNSAVHRVQLDFNPSMGDEIELRAGQLVRLLHEYDDGWAMCIRLDRSQQGVAPRTCLSTRPVKPRPQQNGPRGPPPAGGPQQRPMTPQGQAPRPMTPQGQAPRPMTPNGQGRPMTPNGQQQRPMTPNGQLQQQRPMTPKAQPPYPVAQQPRRPSASGQAPPHFDSPSTSPPSGPLPLGPVSRKPVPGQAM